MDFRPITLEDKDLLLPYLLQGPYRGNESAFSGLYVWQKAYRYHYAIEDGFLFIRGEDEGNVFWHFPCGQGDFSAALAKIPGPIYADENCLPYLPRNYRAEPFREAYDYLYLREELATLSGKKFHAKRNFVNKFQRLYDYTYKPLTPDLVEDCIQVHCAWREGQACAGENPENCALRRGLKAFAPLNCRGGVLYVGHKPVAFTFGGASSADTFVIHFEKALTEYEGAFAMINMLFAQHLEDYTYLNREDDLGLEGLRKAKLSYNPVALLKKYRITEDNL